ncbi:hypothetical protein OG730_37570 [Streptomyces sp. NBC_01298]|uniref:hypothetical protein n=1 Tax=Streptomyces sp. NBC_01298 TaxID=2903817 RepID=UPI002E12DA33|nr:hypothetical protein OG730_37570 [Streptomyces sp. NBC_01298]
MHGHHARPTSTLFRTTSSCEESAAGAGRHAGGGGILRRLRRRILAYQHVELLSSRIPGDTGTGDEVLLLVHVRKVVGEVHYRMCLTCAEAVITGVDIDPRFLGTGLDTRALSHLRARHPGLAWHSTLNLRGTRDLLRRSRILDGNEACHHLRLQTVQTQPAS